MNVYESFRIWWCGSNCNPNQGDASKLVEEWKNTFSLETVRGLRACEISTFAQDVIQGLNKVPLTDGTQADIQAHLIELSKQRSHLKNLIVNRSIDLWNGLSKKTPAYSVMRKIVFALNAAQITPFSRSEEAVRVVRLKLENKDIEGAKITTSIINESSPKNHSLYAIAQAELKNKDIEGARATASTIEDSTLKDQMRYVIAQAQLGDKDNEDNETKPLLVSDHLLPGDLVMGLRTRSRKIPVDFRLLEGNAD